MALTSEAGTVRGRFQLDTSSAVSNVRAYRREAQFADRDTRRLGRTIDDAFGTTEVTRIRTVTDEVSHLATTTRETQVSVSSSWSEMRRDVEKETTRIVAAIETVHERMRALSRERATIEVDTDGVARALAQVELLKREMGSLSRMRVTPRVSIGGGFSPGFGGGGGGGGGAGLAASRAGRPARGGAESVRSLGLGPLSLGSGTLPALAAVAVPAIQSLTGAATGLGSSLVGAGLGAGAAGLAGGGALAAGIVTVMSVARPATTAMKDAWRAQDRLNDAIRQYGAGSRQARAARADFDRSLQNQPGLRQALSQIRAFNQEWEILTRRGRGDFYGGVADITRIGRRAAPNIAMNANRSTAAVRRAATMQAGLFAGTEMQGALTFFTSEFVRDLPTVERTLRNVELTIERTARAATPFFHDGVVWVREWSDGLEAGSRNIYATRTEIGHLVTEFKDWRDLSGSVFHTIKDIASAASPSGDSMVRDLTRTFDRWDAWVNSHPEQTSRFFSDAASSTEDMATALGSAVRWLNQLATALRPLLDRFSQLVSLASSLGLIGAPGALGAIVGGVRGARGGGLVSGAAVARSGGGVVMGSAPRMGATATAARAAAAGRTYLAPPSSPGALNAQPFGAFSSTGSVGLTSLAISRLGTRKTVVLGDRELGARGTGIATPEGFAAKYGDIEGARYAMPELGASRAYGLSRVGGGAARVASGAGRFAGGAAKAYAPIAIGLGALDAASAVQQGAGFGGAVQQFGSDLTLGAISPWVSDAQRKDRATQYVRDFLDRSGISDNVPMTQRRLSLSTARINAQIQGLIPKTTSNTPTALGLGSVAAKLGGSITGRDYRTPEISKENQERITLLRRERDELARTNEQMRRLARERADERARQAGYAYGSQLGGAFQTYRQHGMSVDQAGSETIGQAVRRIGNIRAAGVEALGEASLAWAREMARRNPALQREVDRLNDSIVARFRSMGRTVQIVNGQILTGSKSEWRGISQAMQNPMEQAREKLSKDFTDIQQQAIGSLVSMGFNRATAQKLVGGLEKGGSASATARSDIGAGPQALPTGGTTTRSTVDRTGAQGVTRARGGMIGGEGLSDTVDVPGGRAAPGEAWIANRHTLARLSRATIPAFGLTAQQMITGETRRHSASPERYAARGGRFAFGGVTPQIASLISRLDGMGFAHGSTTGGTHAATSYHYKGEAVDYGDASNDMRRLWSVVYPTRSRFAELFGPSYLTPPTLMHSGQGFSDPSLQAEHNNHIHMALTSGLGALGKAAPGFGGGPLGSIKLRAPGVRQAGIPGLLRQRAGAIYAAGLQKKVNDHLGSMTGSATGLAGGFSGGGTPRANQELGQRMMLASGYGMGEWPALKALWTKESGWSNTARNPSSGAFGIPQALPPSKMPAAAQQGNAASQIGWGLDYIKGRYGSPSGAWSHEQAYNWYGRGGRSQFAGAFGRRGSFKTDGPTWMLAGERRRERVTVTRDNQNVANRAAGVVIQRLSVRINVTAGNLGDPRQLDALAEELGERFARKLMDAIDRDEAGLVI